MHISALGWGRNVCCMRKMAYAFVGGTHIVKDWTECAQRHIQTTDKRENSISARMTPFTWRI